MDDLNKTGAVKILPISSSGRTSFNFSFVKIDNILSESISLVQRHRFNPWKGTLNRFQNSARKRKTFTSFNLEVSVYLETRDGRGRQ